MCMCTTLRVKRQSRPRHRWVRQHRKSFIQRQHRHHSGSDLGCFDFLGFSKKKAVKTMKNPGSSLSPGFYQHGEFRHNASELACLPGYSLLLTQYHQQRESVLLWFDHRCEELRLHGDVQPAAMTQGVLFRKHQGRHQ